MKLNAANRTLESTIDAPTTQFQIAASAKAFQILSSAIYTKKEEAIIRELLANAADAHVAAGRADTPIQLHMPTHLEPWLEIKDFGTGLSDAQIYSLYTTYFGSDKTGTNDLIGGFGLGSKSPLCYTDQFSVQSRHGDTIAYWSIFIDDAGLPRVTKTGEEPYVGTPGLTVNIPVDPTDIPAFTRAAANLVPYFQVPVESNTPLPFERKVLATFQTPDAKVLIVKDTPYKQAVVQGSIPYQLDMTFAWENEYYHTRQNNVAYILRNWEFEIHVPIGTYEIATSRESLAYDKKTKADLTQLFKDIANHIVEDFENQVSSATTHIDAISLYQALSTNAKSLHQALKRNGGDTTWYDKPTWNNKSLTDLVLPDGIEVGIVQDKGRGSKTVLRKEQLSSPQHKLPAWRFYTYAIEKLVPFYWMEKSGPFKNFFEDNGNYPAMLFIGDREAIRAWLDDLYGKDVKSMTEVLKPPKAKCGRTSSASQRKASYDNRTYATATTSIHSDAASNSTETASSLLDRLDSGEVVVLAYDKESVSTTFMRTAMERGRLGLTSTDKLVPHTVVYVPIAHNKVRKALIDAGALTHQPNYDDEPIDTSCVAKHKAIVAADLPKEYQSQVARGLIHILTQDSRAYLAGNYGVQDPESETLALLWWIMARYTDAVDQLNGAASALRLVPDHVASGINACETTQKELAERRKSFDAIVAMAKARLNAAELTLNDIVSLLAASWYRGAGVTLLRVQQRLLDTHFTNIEAKS